MTSIGEKGVSDERPDTCFHGRMLHRPHARFATSAPTKAALVLSPKSARADPRLRPLNYGGGRRAPAFCF
jgi:hypothetical protein